MTQEMESRFYYFQGETPENTKISDRSHALHVTKEKWNTVTKHLDRKRLNREAAEREERHRAYLQEGSESMIKNWANSLDNIRKRKDEERAQAIENEKAERARKFNVLRKEQEEIRKAFVDKANKNIFMNKGNAKQLTSAFIMSEVLYEREKQKEFKKFLTEHEAEEYAKEVEDVRRVAREAAEEQKAIVENEKRKKLETGERMRKELDAKIKKEKEEQEKRKKKEEQDYREALEEINCMKQKDLEMKLKKKQELAEDTRKLLEQERQNKILLATEEQELDDVIKAYRTAKDKIDCMRKIKEKQLREDAIRIRQEMAEKAKAESKETVEEEKREKSLQKALKEYEEMAIEKERKKAELHAKGVHDKLEGRREFLEKEEQRAKKEAEIRKWEMLNRYKTKEAVDTFDKNVMKDRKNKILEYREDLLQQIRENEDRQKQEKEVDKMITEALNQTDDDKFFAYADEILEQQRKTERSTYPTAKAILGYKKNNRIPLPPNTDVTCEIYKPLNEQDAKYIFTQSDIENKKRQKCRCLLTE